MRSLERVNIRTNVRTYVLTYIRTGQTLYPLHNFVVQGDNNHSQNGPLIFLFHIATWPASDFEAVSIFLNKFSMVL